MLEVEKAKTHHAQQLLHEQSFAFKVKYDFLNGRSMQLSDEIEQFDRTLRKRYEAMIEQAINDSDYALLQGYIDKHRSEKKTELYEILSELDYYRNNISSSSIWVCEYLKYSDSDELTETMYSALVKKVLVYDTGIECLFMHAK
jgi:hypothetical protein